MAEATVFVKEAIEPGAIQLIETFLNQLEGIERVFIDTADGEVIVEFDELNVSQEKSQEAIKKRDFSVTIQ